MTNGRWLAILLVAPLLGCAPAPPGDLSGGGVAGRGPSAPSKPGLWLITLAPEGKRPGSTSRICTDYRVLQGFEQRLARQYAPPTPDQAPCTTSHRRNPDGSNTLTSRCEVTLGSNRRSAQVSTMTISADGRHSRSHTEIRTTGPGHDSREPPEVTDSTTDFLGDCPVPMKPGQFMVSLDEKGRPTGPEVSFPVDGNAPSPPGSSANGP